MVRVCPWPGDGAKLEGWAEVRTLCVASFSLKSQPQTIESQGGPGNCRKGRCKEAAILHQFHCIRNSLRLLWGWESGVSAVRSRVKIRNCSGSKATLNLLWSKGKLSGQCEGQHSWLLFRHGVLSCNRIQLFSILMWEGKHLSAAELRMFQHETLNSDAGGGEASAM